MCTYVVGVGTNYFSSSLEENASSSSSRGMGRGWKIGGLVPPLQSQHLSTFLCLSHSFLCFLFAFSTQLLFIPPLFCALLRTSKEADQKDREGALAQSVRLIMGSDLDFKKLAVERVYRNGFYFGIS